MVGPTTAPIPFGKEVNDMEDIEIRELDKVETTTLSNPSGN
jgi:hypothetical protein